MRANDCVFVLVTLVLSWQNTMAKDNLQKITFNLELMVPGYSRVHGHHGRVQNCKLEQ